MKTAFTDDTRNRWIQLGCGPHPLPSPWENYDREVNITKPLPFPDESVRFLFAEHLIEHVHFTEGLAFLRECYRVLEPRGVLRLAFPDVTRFNQEGMEALDRTDSYLHFLRTSKHRIEGHSRATVFRFLLLNNGHKAAWSADIAHAACAAVGFTTGSTELYGDSEYPELRNIERHHFSVPESAALAETTIIEASK